MSTENLLPEEKIKQLETELQKATALLHQYKKEHEEFIQIASHDLQAPLRKLTTFVERVTNKFKNVSSAETDIYVERIFSTVKNMRTLIDTLSVLSDVTEAEKDFLQCDLVHLLQNIIKDHQPSISANNVSITFSALPVIEGNCKQLKHLFENLIHNSITFQKKDTPLQITITAEKLNTEEQKEFNLSAQKIYFKIDIMDNGIGFEDQYADKIFQPFKRLHGNSEYGGNGIGLAICKKIIENHNGIIFAKGTIDLGARFTLILPQTSN